MAISYAWDVSTVDTYPTKDSNSDVVYNVHWRLTATDGTNKDSDGNNYTAGVYGSASLDTDSISSFTAFGSLDAAKVQGWVEAALNANDKDFVKNMKAGLDAEIAEKITPTSVTKTIGS